MSTANATISIAHDGAGQRSLLAVTAAYFGAFIALGLTTGVLGPTLPLLAAHTHSRLSTISYLFTARSLGYVIGSLRGGKMFDKRTGHPVMAGTLGAMAAMMIMVPLAPSILVLAVVMLGLGAAEATLDVGANTLLVWTHRRRVGPLLNVLHSCFGIGALVAPVIVAVIVSLGHNALGVYPLLALLLLPLAPLLFRLPSPVAWADTKRQEPVRNNRRIVLLICAFLFLYVGAEVCFGGWVFTYAVALRLSQTTTAAYLTSIFWGALTFGRLVAVPVAARFSARKILIADLAGCLLSLLLITLLSHSFPALLVGTLCLGFFMASIFPMAISFAGQHLTLSGHATGYFIVGASLGAMSLPLLAGQLFEVFGPRVVIYVMLGAIVSASAMLSLPLSQPIQSETDLAQ